MSVCIEGDDVTAAGITHQQFADLLQGSGRARLRRWLEGLAPGTRAVFVLRAVAGYSNDVSADLLRSNGGPGAYGWHASMVGDVFRHGLCSLASQLVHAADQT